MAAYADFLLMLIRRSKGANSSGGNSSAFGRSWWSQMSQAFTTRAEVIVSVRGFTRLFGSPSSAYALKRHVSAGGPQSTVGHCRAPLISLAMGGVMLRNGSTTLAGDEHLIEGAIHRIIKFQAAKFAWRSSRPK